MPKANSIARSMRTFHGRTVAYRNFRENIWKTQQLLEIGLSGIASKTGELDTILKKFESLDGKPGRIPKDFEPEVEASRAGEDGEITLKLDDRSAWFMKKVLASARTKHTTLRFHLYTILTVAIWGSFETYIVMLFEELYRKRPEMLKSDEQVTFRDVLEHRESVLEFLIERQLDKIGHFTLTETLKYLRARISFAFGATREKRLTDLYLIRNIVAHNMGIVQGAVRDRVPKEIIIKDNQLHITKVFLEGMLRTIWSCGKDIETYVARKFY